MSNYYSTDFNKILEQENQRLEESKKKKQNDIKKIYDDQVNVVKSDYDSAINETKISYEDEKERNAVQKIINERTIAEKNANLGLTDSGLNRSQQTAVELSYANANSNIDLSRRKAIDQLTQSLASAISSIEQNRITSLADLDSSFETQARENAINIYNANVEANSKMYQTQQNTTVSSNTQDTNEQKIYWFSGVSKENGNYIYYNTETGKNEEISPFTNPYTLADNRTVYSKEYQDKNIGFFNLTDGVTGYQPRGLVSEGGRFVQVVIDNAPLKYDLYGNGKFNSIWFSPSRHYWIWDDLSNSYINMDETVIEYMKERSKG